jgi:predicted GH43/DUF377 family glycosyl hydrolase
VFWPSVVPAEDGYRMYYGGESITGVAIGLATSADGRQWVKHDDPLTTDRRLVESDPVLTPEADWELTRVDRPRVQRTPDGWAMLYQAGQIETRGLALSDDGLRWARYPSNPIFTRASFPLPNARTWDTALVYHDGAYYYFMEIGSLQGTDLYLALHEGPLRMP